jgi:hypothetical protein
MSLCTSRAIGAKDGFGRPFFLVQCGFDGGTARWHRSSIMLKHRRLHLEFNMRQLVALGWSVSGAVSMCAWAQEAIYRCGHEYTNAPRDVRQCERMAPQAVTVITGTRPSPPRAAASVPSTSVTETRTSPETPRTAQPQQAERDLHARTIVGQELGESATATHRLGAGIQRWGAGEMGL